MKDKKKEKIMEKFDRILPFSHMYLEGRDVGKEIKDFLQSSLTSYKSQILKEIGEVVKDYFARQSEMCGGKIPFVIFEGKADEKEKITIYEKGIQDTLGIIKMMEKADLLSPTSNK